MNKILGKVVGGATTTPIAISNMANALKGQAKGCPLIITDISPIKHDITASEDVGATSIVRCGKNLVDLFGRTEGNTASWSAKESAVRKFEFDKYYVGLTAANAFNRDNVTEYKLDGDTWEITSKAAGYSVAFPVRVLPNTQYACGASVYGTLSLALYDKDGVFIKTQSSTRAFVTPENCEIAVVCLIPAAVNTSYQFKDVQLEFGSAKTEYETYVEPIEYTSNQEPIKTPSLYPTTVLYETGGAGTVTAEYNRDINKAFAELQNAMISLGGNV